MEFKKRKMRLSEERQEQINAELIDFFIICDRIRIL